MNWRTGEIPFFFSFFVTSMLYFSEVAGRLELYIYFIMKKGG